MIRRIVSVLILALFLFGLASPAMAQGESAKIGQEEALKIARAAFDIPDSQKNVQISYREEEYNNKKIWDFNWDFSGFNKYRHISVGIDADTGEVLNYFENQEPSQNKKPAKLKTEEECKKIAVAMMQKIAPGKFSQTKEKSNPYPKGYAVYGQNTYSFLFERQVNGTAFPENTVNITVNAENGKVINYYCNWDSNLTFPALDQTIKPEEAEKIFREKIGLQLTYISPYGWSPAPVANKKTIELYYSIGDLGSYGYLLVIDANTGILIDGTGKEAKVSQKVYRPVLDEPVISMPEKTLTLEEAKAKVRDFVDIPSEYKLQSTRYSEGWGGINQKVWDFQYSPNTYGGEKQLNVTVNAVTGEVLSYNIWDVPWGEPEDKPVNYDINKCQKIATDYLKRAVPGKAAYVSLVESPAPQVYYNGKAKTPQSYSFSFVRIVRGIPFPTNSINIEVDNNTGEIRSFRQSWDIDSKFVENKGAISPEEAMNKLLAVEKPRLVYIKKPSADGRPSSEVMPVYQLFTDFPKIVESRSGKVTSEVELQNPVKLDDISGHWAESEIGRLAAWGVVSGANNKFYPDKQITRAEFVTMLVAAKGLENDPKSAQVFTDVPKSSWCYNAIQAAAQAGLVKGSGGKFEPNQIITKQEITVLLIKALNGEKEPDVSAGLPEKFKDENTIAPWARKSVTQALELGIIRGQNGYLKVTAPATRAEAAVMLARTLENSSNMFGYGAYGYGATRVYG